MTDQHCEQCDELRTEEDRLRELIGQQIVDNGLRVDVTTGLWDAARAEAARWQAAARWLARTCEARPGGPDGWLAQRYIDQALKGADAQAEAARGQEGAGNDGE